MEITIDYALLERQRKALNLVYHSHRQHQAFSELIAGVMELLAAIQETKPFEEHDPE